MSADNDLGRRGADNLVRHHLRVAAGERVVIFHLQADDVLPTLRAALDEAGAPVELVALGPWSAIVDDREFARLVTERVRGAAATMYVSGVDGPAFARSTLLVETLNRARARHLHVPGVSPRMLTTSLRADPALLEQINGRLVAKLGAGRALTVSSAAGTDLTIALGRGYPFVDYHGVPAAGAWDSVPTGAVNFFSPAVSGTYVADRIARGSYVGKGAHDVSRTPLILHFEGSVLRGHDTRDPVLHDELRAQLERHPQAGHLGFVSFSTNYLARNELRIFAHDSLLPGLRLQLGYSDQPKTRAPTTAPFWATFLGRRQTVSLDGEVLVRDGRLDPRWASDLLPF